MAAHLSIRDFRQAVLDYEHFNSFFVGATKGGVWR